MIGALTASRTRLQACASVGEAEFKGEAFRLEGDGGGVEKEACQMMILSLSFTEKQKKKN